MASAIAEMIAKAKATTRNPRPSPGSYVYKVEEIKMFQGASDMKNYFLADLVVVEAAASSQRTMNSPSGAVEYTPPPPAGVGTKVSYLQECGPFQLGSIKSFLAAIAGISPDEVNAEGIDEAISDEQPAKGLKVACFVEHKNKKNKKGEWKIFDEPNFAPMAPVAEVQATA